LTGAVLISLVIIYRWVDIIGEQVKKIVGHTAPPEYIEKVRPHCACSWCVLLLVVVGVVPDWKRR
jgi:divalent metal cation (Fe/Co/Zn/Cd) transporter